MNIEQTIQWMKENFPAMYEDLMFQIERQLANNDEMEFNEALANVDSVIFGLWKEQQ